MIIQIGVALALILGAALFGMQGQEIASDAMTQLMSPLMVAVQGTMTMLAHLAPILVMALPVYLVFRDEGEATPMALTWGAGFGVLLFALIQYTGIDLHLIQTIQQSYTGSLIGTLGIVAEATFGVLTVATYYLAGILLTVLSVILEVVTGIGSAAETAKRHVRRAEKSVLTRIMGRLTE